MDVRHRSISIRAALMLIFTVTLFGATAIVDLTKVRVYAAQATEPTVPNYSCFNCFALAYWEGHPFDGISSNISMRPLNYCCGSTEFLSNKMYVTSHLSNHWMEIGYRSRIVNLDPTNDYFWAEICPIDNIYRFYYLGNAEVDWNQSSNLYIERTGPASFVSVVDGVAANYYGYSTDNTIAPGWIDIGTELRGTSGASMTGSTHWTSNQWKSVPEAGLCPPLGWCYQEANGSQTVNYPTVVLGAWDELPSNSKTGGDWYTTCCNPTEDAGIP
jgi:hypothetical protein